MKMKGRYSWRSLAIIAVLLLILIVLAVLQYRWSGRVSEAEGERMQTGLRMAVYQFQREFHMDLQRICTAFQDNPNDPADKGWMQYATKYENWLWNTTNTRLIENIYIWNRKAQPTPQLLRLHWQANAFEPVSWPSHMEKLPGHRYFSAGNRPPEEFQANIWKLMEDVPLLVHALESRETGDRPSGGKPSPVDYLILELNREVLQKEIIPDIAQKCFTDQQGFLYHIAIRDSSDPGNVLYRSDSSLPQDLFSKADITTSLFPSMMELFPRMGPAGGPPEARRQVPPANPDFRQPNEERPRQDDRQSNSEFRRHVGERRERDGQAADAGFRPPPELQSPNEMLRRRLPYRSRIPILLTHQPEENHWLFFARHREGTLKEVVQNQRRRNLAIGFGILLLLGSSMTMILVSTQRAQKLAKLQMDFVAGVSHELRTPLAVIRAAGDNLAAGVVTDSPEQVMQYGRLVRQEGERLTEMVEQILQFVGAQAGNRRLDLRTLQIPEIIESVLVKLQPVFASSGIRVEKQIEDNLPAVKADAKIVERCLENLINNAVKYGGDSRWVGIRARCLPTRKGSEIQIAVEDKGIGMEKTDMLHIFEPFYRSQTVIDAQIHGNGLGLSLAKEGIAAMAGHISLKSKPGMGSTFTVHLPVAADPPAVQAASI